jgi:protein-L-isoaspartate(D-aspartate) O-methyltransferase
VDDLERRGAIRSAEVRRAFLRVPRELFVPEKLAADGVEAVYRDEPIVTKVGGAGVPLSSSSQPAIMAEMLERLGLEPGLRVLEIGAGTGYNAALLAELVGPRGSVRSVDVEADTAARARGALRRGGYRVRVAVADGREGLVAGAPYDRIVVTASSDTVPYPWFEQLVDGGSVEVPLRLREGTGGHVVASLQKTGRGFRSVSVVAGGFMPLRDAGDGGLPPGMSAIAVTDLTGSRHVQLRQLSGSGLARLSTTAKRRLAAVALDEPRRRRLPVRADARALAAYLSLTLPAARAVAVLPEWGVGVIARGGAGLAYVPAGPGTRRTVSALLAHGDPTAERELLEAVSRWVALGRPGAGDVRIRVTYGATPELRWRFE